jgi:hypothetical protein
MMHVWVKLSQTEAFCADGSFFTKVCEILHVCMCVYACMHACMGLAQAGGGHLVARSIATTCKCTYVCVCLRVYVCECMFACVCMYKRMYVCTYICTLHPYIQVDGNCEYVNMYLYMCICKNLYWSAARTLCNFFYVHVVGHVYIYTHKCKHVIMLTAFSIICMLVYN